MTACAAASACRSPRAKFAHGAEHQLPGGRRLIDSYHCSRYNQNTGRLDAAMFEAVFERVASARDSRTARPRAGGSAGSDAAAPRNGAIAAIRRRAAC